MTERQLEKQFMDYAQHRLPTALLWKIRDHTTGGQPDLELCWSYATWKFEFKLLKRQETVHDKWEDERQLITMFRYEQTTARAFVVAWHERDRRGPAFTRIYRPSELLHQNLPSAQIMTELGGGRSIIQNLLTYGAVEAPGISHEALVQLIQETAR